MGLGELCDLLEKVTRERTTDDDETGEIDGPARRTRRRTAVAKAPAQRSSAEEQAYVAFGRTRAVALLRDALSLMESAYEAGSCGEARAEAIGRQWALVD
jgi:hypothetical protein